MIEPTSTTPKPAEVTAGNFAALAIDRVSALRLQHQLILLAMMELVRQANVQSELFNSLAAVANGLAELEHAFNRTERELVACLPAGSRHNFH